MKELKLQIITPRKIILQDEVSSITLPSLEGELTILYNHTPLFASLKEGVVKIKKDSEISYYSIGGGYVEITGKGVNILVTRAYHQDEIDEKAVESAKESAEKLLRESKTQEERHEAMLTLRRSLIDFKVLKFKRRNKKIIS